MEAKKVLILTYYWPPSGGSGVQRWMYFARFLEENGIFPTVVTVDEKYASYGSIDASFAENVRHVSVFKTKTLEPIRFYSFLKSGNSRKTIPHGNVGGSKKGLFDKLATWVRGNFFIPDARIGWNRYAYKQAYRLLTSETFDAVITTGPPHSTHLVGLKLKQELGVKWIADFRDPWTEVYYNDLFSRTEKNRQKDLGLELSVLKQADRILTVGPSMRELLAAKIPGQAAKVSYIYNGYDSGKLNDLKRIPGKQFTISYVGVLSSNYPYEAFISALRHFLHDAGQTVTLKLVGNIEPDVIAAFSAVNGIDLRISGNIPHREALQTMVDSDLLLLILPMNERSRIIVSGKLMEYIACSVPVLGIVDPESDAAQIISGYAHGKAFHPEQQEEIVRFLSDAVNHRLPDTEVAGDIRSFDRRNTAKQLAALIAELTSRA